MLLAHKWLLTALCALILPLVTSSPCSAATFLFSTPDGAAVNSNPVSATVEFFVQDGELQITLTNNQDNPTADTQTLNNLTFQITSAVELIPLFISQSGQQVTITDATHYQIDPQAQKTWRTDVVAPNNNTVEVCDLCRTGVNSSAWNDYTLIGAPGPSGYSNANGSIRTHQPMLYQQAKFVLSITGLLSTDAVSSATFGFGTSANWVSGSFVPDTASPEPTPGALLFGGLLLIGIGAAFRKIVPRRN